MLFLPDVAGPHKVGATTFALQLQSPSVIGTAKLRLNGTGQLRPALPLEEVAFTAFYPAELSPKNSSMKLNKGIDWLLRPVRDSLNGYAQFGRLSKFLTWMLWPVMHLYGSRIKVPVYPNAPLLKSNLSTLNSQKHSSPWPLVIFSHGLGGSRTAYSQICSRIAASGRVVLAIEHRDGSGHACIVRSLSGETTTKLYTQEDEVIWESDKPSDAGATAFRNDQLTFRRQEIYLAYSAFRSTIESGHHTNNSGQKLELQTIDESQIDWESWSKNVKCESDVALVGHSFGGATVLSLLSNPTPENHSTIPVTKALVLDPWLEPLPSPGPTPQSDRNSAVTSDLTSGSTTTSASSSETTVQDDEAAISDIPKSRSLPRMLVLNSDMFTLWKDHFERLKGVVEAWEPEGRRVLTLVRAEHVSFSDFPLLPILRRASAQILMDLTSKLSLAFLDGDLDDVLKNVKTRKMEIEIIGKRKDGRPKRQIIGDVGDVIVH